MTKTEKINPPAVWMEGIEAPEEPTTYTWESLVQYVLQLQTINQRHNADKAALREWREE